MYIDVFVFVQGVLYISMTLLWFQTRTMLPPLPSLGLRHLGKRPVVNQRRGRQEVGAFFLSRRSDFLWDQKIWKHFFYGLLCVIFLVWNVSFFPYWSKFFKTSLWNSPFVLFEDFRCQFWWLDNLNQLDWSSNIRWTAIVACLIFTSASWTIFISLTWDHPDHSYHEELGTPLEFGMHPIEAISRRFYAHYGRSR